MKSIPSRILSIRLSLSIALIASGSVCALNVLKIRERILNLEAHLKQQIIARRLAETQWEAAAANLRLTARALEVATQERQQALSDAQQQSRRAQDLSAALTSSQHERDQVSAELSRFRAAGMEPEQIVSAAKDIKNLRVALFTVQERNKLLEQRLQEVQVNDGPDIQLPPELKARVILFDSKWRFVVLDSDSDQGIVKDAELLVSRNDQLVSKVKVTSVQKVRSIANLLPGWQLGDIAEGDLAIPAHPRSLSRL